jgi:hypothetical protein
MPHSAALASSDTRVLFFTTITNLSFAALNGAQLSGQMLRICFIGAFSCLSRNTVLNDKAY